jgi:DNA primase
MAYPDGFLEEVRRSADIVRYISEHVALRKAGNSWKGLCPFHREKTPSFNVRQEPAVFHCFGCGAGGDVFKFAMLHERVSFPEAIEMVARRFGVPLPETRSFDAGPERKQKDELLALLESAAQHFTRNLWTAPGTRAREYLLGRGFKKETLERIRAGAAPDAWTNLFDALRPKHSVESLKTAGLVREKEGRGSHYDWFRNRAVFPILGETGKVIAFGGRALDPSDPAKYMNSPESPVYQKSRTLYGFSWAKDAIRTGGHALLMEGYLDVARALELGFAEAVATCGTALTAGHARLLRRFTGKVVVNFDQDAAGIKAARKSVEVLIEEGLKVHIVELPEGHDPDSFLKAEGAAAYGQRIAEAPDFMEWLVRRACTEHDLASPSGKAGYLAALLPALVRIENAVERSAWLSRVAERGGLDERAAREEMRRAMAGASRGAVNVHVNVNVPGAPAPPPTPKPELALVPAEKWLLTLILQNAEGVADALCALEDLELSGLRTSAALREARRLALAGEAVTVDLLAAAAGEDDGRLLRELAVQPPPVEAVPAECVKELKRRPLRARMAEIQRELPRAQGPVQEKLLAEKLSLTRQMASW